MVVGEIGADDSVKGLIVSESGLPNRDAHGVLSGLNLICDDGVGCFHEAWLRKSHGYCGRQRREYRLTLGRDLRQQVSSLILAMAGQPPPYLLYPQPAPPAKAGKADGSG